MENAFAVYAAYFATLVVAFPRAMVVPAAEAPNGVRAFRAFLELHNNIAHVEAVANAGFYFFNATKAVAQNVARHGFDVRHVEGDRYMVRRSLVGVRLAQ